MGDFVQVSGSARNDSGKRHSGECGKNRCADSVDAAAAGADWRSDGEPFDAAQHGRSGAAGSADRGYGADRACRRSDSACVESGEGGEKPAAVSHAEELSGVWEQGPPRGGRSRVPVLELGVSGKTARIAAALCEPARHEHRWIGRKNCGSTGGKEYGKRRSGFVFAEAGAG